MLSDIVSWNTAAIVVAVVLAIRVGSKLIDRAFEPKKKKKDSLF